MTQLTGLTGLTGLTSQTSARLLVVDDETAQMHALCDTLEEQGYEVLGCASAEDALAALRESAFDLLLADLMMPQMNGIDLLRAALIIDPVMVGIIMTGEGTISTAVEAMQSGALDYILKPFKLSAVLPVIGRGLAMRQLRLQNIALEQRVREHAAELEATNRELDAFTRSVSHDLRSPLNAVVGFSSLLAEGLGPNAPAEQRKWLVQVQRAAQNMSELIDALMRLSLAGKQALKIESVDLTAMVRSVVADLREKQPERQMAVVIGELPETQADQSLLRQVFVNLLSNAFKYTRNSSNPEIAVGCTRQDGEHVFTVRDNGSGFDMTQANRLFHPFQRFHRDDQFEGSGIGLSIVQRIVQRHGGRIWARAAPGQGAAFFFTLGHALVSEPAALAN